MFGNSILNAFTDDPTVRLIAVLVALDFALGVLAAFYTKTFRLSFLADVFRNDVLGKVLPYYVLWAALHISGIDWSVGGFDVVEEAAGATIILALTGSVLNSLRDFGLAKDASPEINGADPGSPVVEPPGVG